MTIDTLLLDPEVRETEMPAVRRFERRLGLTARTVDDIGEVYEHVLAGDDPVAAGKRVLYLTRNRGAFVRDCPGTRHYTCCGYRILHIGTFCSMDCAYCILQSYFHPPVLQYFLNHGEMAAELERLFDTPGTHRVGTGEFTDSLIWEPWTDLSQRLVTLFGAQSRAVLELKTKTTAIRKLEHLPHRRHTIVAWSLNTPRVIAAQERGTASLEARLAAARTCAQWGYPLAFHFDPMVIYPGGMEEYRQVVRRLFEQIDPDGIVWISIGTFRFMPALKPIVQRRFPDSRIVYGEFITGLDGKMRYFKPLRIEWYRAIIAELRRHAPEVLIYFCMEDDAVWRKSLGGVPSESGGLSEMLDASARRHCGVGR